MTTKEKYKAIKKALGITDADIAKAHGYASVQSYNGSSGKPKIIKGVVWLYERIVGKITDDLDLFNEPGEPEK